jgi:hypothetical protein
LALAGAAVLAATSAVAPGSATGVRTVLAQARLLDTEAWIMGGSGAPIPSSEELGAFSERYIDPTASPDFNDGQPLFADQPLFPVDATNPLFTPEGLYPFTGVKSLEFDPSAAQGVTILDDKITEQIAEGNNLVVAGSSQSSVIAGLEMRDLLELPADEQPKPDELSFVLRGDEGNPNGSLLERFGDPSLPEFSAPSFGISFTGATPADTPWDTAEYIGEYDGFADYPSYPINLLSDLNAILGMAFVHLNYSDFTADQLGDAIELPVSDDYTGELTNTDYFMIPTETLPLLQPLQYIPVIGGPLYDLLEPDMRILVNLGYGDIEHGWDQGPANVATPFGLFPDIDADQLFTALADGAQQGINDFVDDLGSLDSSAVPDFLGESADGGGGATDTLPDFTDAIDAFTGAASSLYAGLLPVADAVNALTTTLPTYEASLFAQELASGDVLGAIGLPVAAAVGLTPLVGVFGIGGIVEGIADTFGIDSFGL